MDLTPNPIVVPMTVSSNMQSVSFEASSNRQPVLLGASANVIRKPTKTSELINDGENGTSKYVELDDLSIALNNKQDILIFDNTPTEGSLNPATSGGIYNALKDIPDYYTLHITVINQTENMISFSIPQEEHTAILTAYNNHDNFVVLMNVTINNVQYSLVAFPCRTEQLFDFNALVFAVPSKDNGLGQTSFFTVALSLQYANGIIAVNDIDFELLIGQKEDKSNKVQSISSESTASEYPSAKAVYDSIENLEPFIITATQWEQPGAEDTYTLDNATFNDISGAIYNGRNVFIRTTSDTFPYSNLIYDAESNRWAYVFGGTIASGGMIINKFFIVLNTPGNIGTLIRNSEAFVGTVNGQSGYVTLTAESIGALTETEVNTKISTKADSAGASANYSAKVSEGIPFGRCDASSTATVFTATVPGVSELKDGTVIMLENGVVTSASGFTININGLGAKPVYNNLTAATRDTTIFNVAYTMLFVYDETRVAGGCWICYRGYDANTNTIGYQLRTNSARLPSADRTGRYRLLFTSADNTHWVPGNTSDSTSATSAKTVNQRPIDPFGAIRYYGYTSVIAAESMPGAAYMWQQYVVTLGYTFTPIALNDFVPLYLKCTPQANGSAIIDSTTPVVQALPNTNDGFIYIYLGIATSTTAFELAVEHPVYYHDGARIRFWTGSQEIPQAPSTDGTYSLKCIVNNGVVTYSWVND